MKKTIQPDFTGKLFSFSIIGDSYSYAIDCPSFEMQGGRWFVVGTVPHGATTSGWNDGAASAVAWDQVNNYLIFNSAKHYRKGLAKFQKYKKKK
jgi:hypothetical protein